MGVGKSIELMNVSNIYMNKIVKTISSVMVISALMVTTFNVPGVSFAYANSGDGFAFNFGGFDFPKFNHDAPKENTNSSQSSTNNSQTCELKADSTEVATGGSVKLTWKTSGFDQFTLNGQPISGANGVIEMTNVTQNTSYTLVAKTADNSGSCEAKVTIKCLPPPPVLGECKLEVIKSVDKATAFVGDTLTYNITVKNIGTADCTGGGVKIEDVVNSNLSYLTQSISSNLTAGYGAYGVYTAGDRTLRFNGNVLIPGEQGTITWTGKVNTPTSCGDFEIPNQAKATARELNNFNTWAYSQTVKTVIDNDCQNDPAPSCDAFTANPGSIVTGGSSVLSWQTSNATSVTMNNGIGNVAADASVTVSPTTNTTYVLTVFGTQNRSVNCSVPVTVSQDPAPSCDVFTATPNTIMVGQNATLAWQTSNANRVAINNGIGDVVADGSMTVSPIASSIYQLTVFGTQNRSVNCTVPVTVTNEPVFTCQDNVSFTATNYSIDEGQSTTLNWSTTNVDSVSISVINATTLSGSKTVDPRSDTAYVLTAKKGSKSIDCPLTINVDEDGGGGGGGGSPSPRCELTISDNKIKSGEQVTLKWNTSNATEVTIKDNHGKTLVNTDKYLSKDKRDYYDGSLKLKPTRDTEYTIVAERGSKDRTCKVKVDVNDIIVITDRQPLVAGISLSNVPYTGFEAGPMLTILFYTLLIAWALFVTYLIVMRRRVTTGGVMANNTPSSATLSMKQAEEIRPDVFASTIAPVMPVSTLPTNLPTGIAPVVGYGGVKEIHNPVNPHHVTDEVVTLLENRAHAQMALLSSDAIRHFISTTAGTLERDTALDAVIAEAKAAYPLEDGWVVINEARMQNLCKVCTVNQVASQAAPYVPAVVPQGSSSLAEAIVTGNVVAAYEMIGNRPMFALADAASDLDGIVRMRRGEQVNVSELLKNETATLSDEKIKNIITALTGALDGTYTDEASAVKMAIMKAVKEVA
jgi:uncharacterized repeat protein (TIGR01451 family)